MALFAYFLKDDFPDLDINRVILMCLIHDLKETFTGDIPVFNKTEADEQKEEQLLQAWLNTLDEPFLSELTTIFKELALQQTPEAKLVKAIDKLEVVDQHNLAECSTWIELKYSLNLSHGQKQVAVSKKLQEIKAAINEETKNKIEKETSTRTQLK